MDAYRDNGDRPMDADGAPYIWLRYSTQFTTGGRTHTIEMGIPVPLGASAEQREQLIREAEAGMEQLSRRVDSRVAQMLQRNSRPPEATRPQEPTRSPGYSQTGTRPTPPAAPAAPPSRQNQAPQQQPPQAASQTPARETPQPIPLQEKRQTTQATQTTPPRTSIGAEMPVTPNLSGSAPGNIKLGEFIQIIRNNWGLTPKEAMDLLHLGNLSNMNYRDLLRQLEPLAEQRGENAPAQKTPASQPRPVTAPPPSPSPQVQRTPPPAATQHDARPAAPEPKPAPPAQPAQQVAPTNRAQPSPVGSSAMSAKPASSVSPAHSPLPGPPNIPVYPMRGSSVGEAPRVYKFDEEEEEMEGVEEANREGESDKRESQNSMSNALARIKIDELKEKSGSSSAVSQGRLTVLHNLLDSQISDTQFQRLIQGIWNATSDKKLKQDQVEALISWAKEDYFVDEVEVVLAVLNEQ